MTPEEIKRAEEIIAGETEFPIGDFAYHAREGWQKALDEVKRLQNAETFRAVERENAELRKENAKLRAIAEAAEELGYEIHDKFIDGKLIRQKEWQMASLIEALKAWKESK